MQFNNQSNLLASGPSLLSARLLVVVLVLTNDDDDDDGPYACSPSSCCYLWHYDFHGDDEKNGENCFSSEKSHCLYREARAARVAPLIRARASSSFCSPGTKNGFGVILGLC